MSQPTSLPPMPTRRALASVTSVLLLLFTIVPAVAQDDQPGDRPTIVVTTEMLGWLTREVAGDEADVSVLIQDVDPHAFEPSARDAESIYGADLIVANGLGLEEGLGDILERAAADGVPTFTATDHITVRESDETDHEEDGDEAEHELSHAGGDPHLWLDPVAMRDVALALMPVIGALGVHTEERGADLATALEALDDEARSTLDVVPDERRRLVSGHESLGYFADRYGFELVGAVVPGLSTQGEVSAGELAALIETIEREGVPAIFTELGTPLPVASAVSEESGATVVELRVEQLPDDGSYLTFIRGIATTIAEALGG